MYNYKFEEGSYKVFIKINNTEETIRTLDNELLAKSWVEDMNDAYVIGYNEGYDSGFENATEF